MPIFGSVFAYGDDDCWDFAVGGLSADRSDVAIGQACYRLAAHPLGLRGVFSRDCLSGPPAPVSDYSDDSGAFSLGYRATGRTRCVYGLGIPSSRIRPRSRA